MKSQTLESLLDSDKTLYNKRRLQKLPILAIQVAVYRMCSLAGFFKEGWTLKPATGKRESTFQAQIVRALSWLRIFLLVMSSACFCTYIVTSSRHLPMRDIGLLFLELVTFIQQLDSWDLTFRDSGDCKEKDREKSGGRHLGEVGQLPEIEIK